MEGLAAYSVESAQNVTDEQRMAAAVILSAHWRKDPATRVAELSKSNDSFPLHLILLRSTPGSAAVAIGHCRLTKVDGTGEQAALVESVIVDPAERSKGLGRLLMTAAEKAAQERGYTAMYLNTKDKMGFYARLGYSECAPVSSLGANSRLLSGEQLSGLTAVLGGGKAGANAKQPVSSKDKLGCTWMRKALSSST